MPFKTLTVPRQSVFWSFFFACAFLIFQPSAGFGQTQNPFVDNLNAVAAGTSNLDSINGLWGDVGVTARTAGMGGAFTALGNDDAGVYFNPAGLVRIPGAEFMLNTATYYSDSPFFGYGAFTFPFLRDSGSAVVGTPDQCIEAAKRYEAIGCDLLLCLVNPYKIPHDKVMQSIELLGTHVLPAFA